MLKMFSTQVLGLFKKILDNNEFSLEDGARLLAQAAAIDGLIFFRGFGEMAAVETEVFEGAEGFGWPVKKLSNIEEVSGTDRVVLFTRFSDDGKAVELAQGLREAGIPFIAVCTAVEGAATSADDDLAGFADVLIDLNLKKGLLPDESGNRVGYPGAMAGLFVYHALKFTLEEIMEDFE